MSPASSTTDELATELEQLHAEDPERAVARALELADEALASLLEVDGESAVLAAEVLLRRRSAPHPRALAVLAERPSGDAVLAVCDRAAEGAPWSDALCTLAEGAADDTTRGRALECCSQGDVPRALARARTLVRQIAVGWETTVAVGVVHTHGTEEDFASLVELATEGRGNAQAAALFVVAEHPEGPSLLRALAKAHPEMANAVRTPLVEAYERPPEGTAEETLRGLVPRTLALLQRRDYPRLANMVHPDLGLRLGYEGGPAQKVFTVDEVRRAATDSRVFELGHITGRGTPVIESLHSFLSDADRQSVLRHPTRLSYGDGYPEGNEYSYILEFPQALTVHVVLDRGPHLAGFWRGVRLVFAPHRTRSKQERWMLAAIIDDSWSI